MITLRNRDGLTDDEIEEGRWKSVVMLKRAQKQGRKGVSAVPFWTNMLTFANGRTLGRSQLEAIRKAHAERDAK